MGAWWNGVISAGQPQWLASSHEGPEDWPVSLPRVFGDKSLRLGPGRLARGAFSCRWGMLGGCAVSVYPGGGIRYTFVLHAHGLLKCRFPSSHGTDGHAKR